MGHGDTYAFEVPVCETRPMEVLQTLGCPMQLLSQFNEVVRKVKTRLASSNLLVWFFWM